MVLALVDRSLHPLLKFNYPGGNGGEWEGMMSVVQLLPEPSLLDLLGKKPVGTVALGVK